MLIATLDRRDEDAVIRLGLMRILGSEVPYHFRNLRV